MPRLPEAYDPRMRRRRPRPTFLTPPDRGWFPFDATVSLIVSEVVRRGLEVPGLSVDLDVYGTGEDRAARVSRISGEDFFIQLSRAVGHVPGSSRLNALCAASQIGIPRATISVYEDLSGPSYWRYVGSDWARDRDGFFRGFRVNSRLHGEPRTYLRYVACCSCGRAAYPHIRHRHLGAASDLLVHDDDLGREYELGPGDPRELRVADVLAEFDRYLRDVVLPLVSGAPVSESPRDFLADPPDDPVPDPLPGIGPLYCLVSGDRVEALQTAERDGVDAVAPAERYGAGQGLRLVTLGASYDGSFPRVAYQGMVWCGSILEGADLDKLGFPSRVGYASHSERFPVSVRLTRANDVYVADDAEYDRARLQIASAMIPTVRSFTDEQIGEMHRAVARTLVPLSRYRGGYTRPIVLAARELDLDEIGELPSAARSAPARRAEGRR